MQSVVINQNLSNLLTKKPRKLLVIPKSQSTSKMWSHLFPTKILHSRSILLSVWYYMYYNLFIYMKQVNFFEAQLLNIFLTFVRKNIFLFQWNHVKGIKKDTHLIADEMGAKMTPQSSAMSCVIWFAPITRNKRLTTSSGSRPWQIYAGFYLWFSKCFYVDLIWGDMVVVFK